MRTILIDDEPMALEVLERMLSPYEEINIVGSYTRYIEALNNIEKTRPDVIFLDIEMGHMNGLQVAEIIMGKLEKVEIVFVTAYSQYAVEAFEINAIDYLLKPIQEKRLLKAIERLRENIEEKHIKGKEKDILKKALRVSSFGGFQALDNMGNYLKWRTQKSKELFAYLWNRRDRPISKTIIIEAIFPDRDVEKASTLLHTTIYQLRRNLGKLGHKNGIIFFDESYQLNVETRSDLDKLMKIMESGKYNEENIMEILEIYKGDFLEEGYQWALEEQQIYRQLVLNILEGFIRKKLEKEVSHIMLKVALDKAYEIDPLNETIAEMMIHYYGKQNRKLGLETFYNNYLEELWGETELEPIESIVNLYDKYMEML